MGEIILKKCPICNKEAFKAPVGAILRTHCSGPNCSLHFASIEYEEWNNRPREDLLLKVLKEIMDSNGSRGIYNAVEYYDAKEAAEALLKGYEK